MTGFAISFFTKMSPNRFLLERCLLRTSEVVSPLSGHPEPPGFGLIFVNKFLLEKMARGPDFTEVLAQCTLEAIRFCAWSVRRRMTVLFFGGQMFVLSLFISIVLRLL